MITLIHGGNQVLSNARVVEIKNEFKGVSLTFQAKDVTPVQLRENLASQSLFAEKKLVIVENPAANKDLFEEIVMPAETDLVIFADDKLTTSEIQKFQKKFPNLKIEEFKQNPIVFKFLESLAPKNQREMMPLWHAYINSEQPEVALVMLARQIRLLLGDEEAEKMAPWQKQRLSAQAKKFTQNDLINFHSKLLDADYRNKTGQTPLDLSTSLELLLLSL